MHVFEIFRQNGGTLKESSIQVAQVVTPLRASVGFSKLFTYFTDILKMCIGSPLREDISMA